MKSFWIVLIMVLIAVSCNDDRDLANPSITRIRYEIKNSYKDTLLFNLEYVMLSNVQFEDSFEIIPASEKVLFSLSYIAETQTGFTCSDRLVSLTATNRQGNARLKYDPLVPGWWEHSIVPVGIDTFHLCSCTIDSTKIYIDPDSLSIESSGRVDMQHYNEINWNGRKISR